MSSSSNGTSSSSKSKVEGKVVSSRPIGCVLITNQRGKKKETNPGHSRAQMLVIGNETLNFRISPNFSWWWNLWVNFFFYGAFQLVIHLWVDHSLYSWSQAANNLFIVEVHCYISVQHRLNVFLWSHAFSLLILNFWLWYNMKIVWSAFKSLHMHWRSCWWIFVYLFD